MQNNTKLSPKNIRWFIKPPDILLSFLLFSILSSLTSCEHAKLPEASCTAYLTDSITFPCQTRILSSVVYGSDKKTNSYFYDDEDNQRVICFNDKGSSIDAISYPHSLPIGKISGFYAITEDSFAFIEHKKLFSYGVKSKKIKGFDIGGYGIKCEGAFGQYPLEISDSLAFYYSFEDTFAINTQKKWELYMRLTYNETVFNLNRERIENIKAGGFPIEIYPDSNCYYSFCPARCINYKQHEIIYLYQQSNTIYIYNYLNKTFRKTIVPNPHFYPNEKFDMNKIGDFDYISKYLTENCRNQNIIYNKFKNEYYLTSTYKRNYENSNSDETASPIDKTWSILVLDSNFSIKTEINFPAKKYDFASILALQKGVLVGYYSNFNSTSNYSKYAVFEF